ncbi:MAG: flagellar biosynthetic protein FliQ [Dinoroseobacter sp.]|nr:flagellar biosynthetic protein FliQ [Dinoroseobacter sp.]
MTESELYDILRESLWTAVLISAPTLSSALIVGLLIGLLQALTSIQEMTLTFVPKLLAMVCVLWVTINPMTQLLVSFFQNILIPKASGI